ncbi:hypothetical protein JTB14_016821 [Gonioctena quinquepunctata]|nr:hypothetical protein JTB14_016821 [Gonioctena quinquepunctata]
MEGGFEEMNISKHILQHGYPLEIHEIQTEDGYLLTLYRIPHGRYTKVNHLNNEPVLINHALLGSAKNFVILGPSKSLGYFLPDNGYDVWLMNARGSWHSRKHRTMNPDKDKEFWQFTWHEIGVYDIPATIDYILNTTNSSALHYIGHSQGSTSLFVMGSERSEYNKKVKVMIAMTPAVYMKNFKMVFMKLVAILHKNLEVLADRLSILELPPLPVPAEIARRLEEKICSQNIIEINICKKVMSIILSSDLTDLGMVPIVASVMSSGCSVKQLLHCGQTITTENFEQYDWGYEKNVEKYGSKTPRKYDIKRITFPVAIFAGENDGIAVIEDVEVLSRMLPNVIHYNAFTGFGHLYFIIGNYTSMLNKKILTVLKRYD